jgi:response regulator RpfG family c-di-GMP phosphodiesterase
MRKVLIVDDEKSIRTTLGEFLKKEGIPAETAADAEEAIRLLDNGEFDVVVSDIIMPKVSGMEMVYRIRERSEAVQIIVMTGEPTVDTAVKSVQNGANDYLIKPVARGDFIRTVRRAMQLKKMIDDKAALEIQNQQYRENLEKMVEQKTVELQKAMQSIISLLAAVVEVRDPYTAGHQRRVGNLAAAIASRMRLDEGCIRRIRVIGYIHDIGKIVIPTEILSKPGKLSPLEMAMIRTHSSEGHDMLSRVDLPDYIGETVFQHHERCDGSGYPRGLTQRDISVEARVLMVADVVEAMMSHRPYRPALGREVALAEIRQNAGKLFSADVVSACLALFDEDRYELEETEYNYGLPIS